MAAAPSKRAAERTCEATPGSRNHGGGVGLPGRRLASRECKAGRPGRRTGSSGGTDSG
eukprot:NODE_2661_length_563_cov_6.404669_g2283_i0.p6 GENE.NODE_2661_length_563_cov_6.404669_g2283_i0~~NODE_2661_length_563_cov_6.404669_g2283_i0.p6  ORF type:complete len:58 (+),score=5.64 NODE_2661_length_563_cov_6.404669_g2283_i0:318-491(+)